MTNAAAVGTGAVLKGSAKAGMFVGKKTVSGVMSAGKYVAGMGSGKSK